MWPVGDRYFVILNDPVNMLRLRLFRNYPTVNRTIFLLSVNYSEALRPRWFNI